MTYSRCQGRLAEEEGPRKEPRTDNGTNRPARSADILDRGGKYQPGDAECDEDGRSGHDTDSREHDDR